MIHLSAVTQTAITAHMHSLQSIVEEKEDILQGLTLVESGLLLVMKEVREGAQSACCAYARLKMVLCAPSWSMLGVRTSGSP